MTRERPLESSELDSSPIERRTVLKGVAAAGGIGLTGLGTAQQDEPVQIQLGGETSGWTVPEGIEAPYIGPGPNPTLNLETGTEYEVTWENVDGQPHNFAILDGNEDPILSTAIISEQGATQTTTFTAEEGMAAYICQVHPVSMRGDVQLGGPAGEGGQPQAGVPFFEQGPEVGVSVVAEGMTAPTDMAQPPGEDTDSYVTDQTGEVWIATDDGRQDEPFVDVSDRLVAVGENYYGDYSDPDQNYDERGLLGISFHPDYANNRQFYLHYSAPPDGVDRDLPADNWDHWEILAEFQASEDGTSADPESERRLLEIPSPQYNHDGGPITFGPDGYLYFPMGDGGGANDNMYGHVDDWYETNGGGNGQDVEANLLGDVLRIDVDGGASETPQGDGDAADNQEGDRPYAIPEDNPFAGEDNPGMDEIYAYGFRNPFGIDFDSDGNLFVADAGQNLFESAYVVERGGNYGWNVTEGTHCFSTENAAEPDAITDCPEQEPDEAPYDGSELQDPIVEYPHTYQGTNVGITIIGGHRYEQSTIPELQGNYVFGDWTQDPARRQPAGRVLAAIPPADFGQQDQDEQQEQTPSDTAADGNMTAGDNATMGDNATDENSTGAQADGEEVVPRDELWEMREVVVQGSGEGASLDRFVRQFGQDNQGNVYVLVNARGGTQAGWTDSETGMVLQLVPPGEGEELEPPELPEQTPTPAPTDGNATDGNATDGAMDGNTTNGNATDGS